MREREGKRRASYVRDKRAGLAESGFLEVSDPGVYPTFTLAPRPASGNLNYTDAEYFIVEVQANAYSTATSYLDTITLRYQGTLPTPTPTATPTVTPTNTLTPTTTPVPSYNIRYSNELGQTSSNWSVDETGYIQTAVQTVGEAFQIQLNTSTPQNAFNRVLTNGADPQYVYFFKAEGNSSNVTIFYPTELSKPNFAVTVAVGGCLTVNNNGLPRTVVCNWGTQPGQSAPYPIHAIVHELGHVFTNRSIISSTDTHESTRGLLYAALHGTFSGNCTPAFAPINNPDPFAGMVFSESACETINDLRNADGLVMGIIASTSSWVRGERGWGSGPDNVFTPFQQHPLDVFPSDPPDTQVDETAADMFLNWVYRRRTNNPPTYQTTVPGTWEGFSNQQWLNNAAGGDDFNYPGDARFEWMNRVMNQIYSLKGW
ncbi:MAG: hypothetical protein SF162_13150 [bacterium]|nr:hypothetical protein [bacterium]